LKILKITEKISIIAYRTAKLVSTATALTIVLLNCANLISRWFFQTPFDWILEISLILFVYAVMFVVPVLYYDRAFIQMNLVNEILGSRGTKYMNLAADLLVLLFFIYLVFQGLSLSLGQFEIHSRGLGIPRIYVTIPLSLGALLSIPAGLLHFLRHIRSLSNN
jgi:TRAP-type C4-dicarboxylate transport system permease small subunit